jgi:hypothetical protein
MPVSESSVFNKGVNLLLLPAINCKVVRRVRTYQSPESGKTRVIVSYALELGDVSA